MVSSRLRVFLKAPFITQLYLLLYIAIMFSGATFIKPFIVNIVIVEIILLSLMVFIKGVPRHALLNRHDRYPFGIILLFIVFLAIQLHFTYSTTISLVYIKRYMVYSFLLLLVPRVDVCAIAIKISKYYSFVVACSILLMLPITGENTGGLVGTYQYAGMLMSIGCILFLIDYFDNGVKRTDLIGFIFCLSALLTSGKRMFALIILTSFLIIYINSNSKKKIQRLFLAITIIGVSIVAMYILIPPTRELFNRIAGLSGSSKLLTSGRNVLWEKAIEVFNGNKVAGIGFGSFERYFSDHYWISGIGAYLTHNIYIGLLAETGIVGFVIFSVFMLYALRKTLRIRRVVARTESNEIKYVYTYSLLLQIWFIIYGFSGNGIYDADVTFFYFSAIAMMISINEYLIRDKMINQKSRKKLRLTKNA